MLNLDSRLIDALTDIARCAGQEIMEVYSSGGQTWDKEDNSPLTEADLRADRVIRQRLESEFPGVFIWSEESVSEDSGNTAEFFLVDPLDGTKEFLKRNGEFTVNIALIQHGKPVAGVVYAPALGEMYQACAGIGSFATYGTSAEQIRLRLDQHAPANVLNVIGSRSHGSDAVGQWLEVLGVPTTMVAAGSSLKFCRVAQGQADLYPRFGPTCQWDTAAGQAVIEVAGGLVIDRAGHPLLYGLERPKLNPEFIVVCNPALAKTLKLISA